MDQAKDTSKTGNAGPWFIESSFDDFDAVTAATRQWDAEFVQLDAGAFEAGITQILSPSALLLRCRLGNGVEQRGALPEACRTFGIPLEGCTEFLWRGHRIRNDQLLLYPRGAELGSRSFEGFHIYAFSVRESVIDRLSAQEGMEWLAAGGERVSRCDASTIQAMRTQSSWIEHLARSASGDANIGPQLESMLEELARMMAFAMSGRSDRRPKHMPSSRDRAIHQALALIDRKASKPLTVVQLCAATGVSRRTLQYAFEERFQLSPKQYLMARRLVEVKRKLRRQGNADIRIGEVAAESGFWHMGQFAADFRRQFGLLPSEYVAGL